MQEDELRLHIRPDVVDLLLLGTRKVHEQDQDYTNQHMAQLSQIAESEKMAHEQVDEKMRKSH